MHAFSCEHMEVAAYELLGRVARRAGDQETVALAEQWPVSMAVA